MMKRERDDVLEKAEGFSNGNKIQRVGGQSAERVAEDSRGAGSQDVVGGLSVRKNNRQRGSSQQRGKDELLQETYKEGKRFRTEHVPKAEGEFSKLLVRISVEHLQPHNRQVKARQLWGVDVYMHDSDLVAVLMHCGYISHSSGVPRDAVAEAHVVIEYLPPCKSYPSLHRNGVRSRAWGHYEDGYSFKVARCVLVTRTGNEEEVQASPNGLGLVVPTFTPAQFERVISTRASASSVERRQRAMQEVTVQYNLCNEPWLKYSMQVIADRGLKPSQLTSARLRNEVLYMETANERFEICAEDRPAPGEQPDSSKVETYCFARCTRAYPLPKLRSLGIPLPAEHVEVLGAGLPWEDIQWSPTGVALEGKHYPIQRLHFTGIYPAAHV